VTEKKKKPKRHYVTYNKTKIPVPENPRKGQCVSCKRKVGNVIKVTQLHHTIYAFLLRTVKKKPLLALKNILELCFPCHKTADAFRMLLDRTSYERILMVFKVLPRFQQERMLNICEMLLEWEAKHLNRDRPPIENE